MDHVPHKMAELALNSSHRYSPYRMSSAILNEYHYLLSAIRQNHRDSINKSCMAVIPSTLSWTYINCQRQFIDATFLCQYTPESTWVHIEDLCPDINQDYYCKTGWLWGFRNCLRIQLIATKYISRKVLHKACSKVKGAVVQGYSYLAYTFISHVLSYLGLNYVALLKNDETIYCLPRHKAYQT